MAKIRLFRSVVLKGQILISGSEIEIPEGLDYSHFGESIETKLNPVPEPKRTPKRSKSDPKPDPEVKSDDTGN